MKKILSVFIILLFILDILSSPASVNAAEKKLLTYKGFKYVYTDKGVHIINYRGNKSKVTVPAEIDGKKVVKLGVDLYEDIRDDLDMDREYYGGFGFSSNIEEVTVPGIKLADGVFKFCPKLKKVTLKPGIKSITTWMFQGCKKLKTVSVPNTVTCIQDVAFVGCKSLKKIKLPSSLKRIGLGSFRDSGVQKIALGKNFTSLASLAFDDGSKLQSIKVSEKNQKFSSSKGVMYNKKKTKLFCYPPNRKGKAFVIPKKVKTVSEYAFCYNQNLKSIVISSKVKKINSSSFFYCLKLSNLTIKSKKNLLIDEWAFYYCKSLKTVTLPKNVVKIRKKAFGYVRGNNGDKKVKGFTIKGYKGTAAEKYAKKNGFKFVALG